MRMISALLVLVFVVTAAHADLLIQQKIESAEQNGIVTLKIKGDQTRKDMPSNRLGEISAIENFDSGDTILMIHAKKVARTEYGALFKQKLNSGDTNAPTPKPIDANRTEKVGIYDAEIYTWTNNIDAGGTFWVVKDYPDYAKIKPYFTRLNQSPVNQIRKRATPDAGSLPGMVVKAHSRSPLGEITTTLISAKEETLNDADFQIPAGYRVVGVNN